MSIVLNMTVGDEAHVVARALRSCKPFVDEYVVHCNGTDSTSEIVEREMAGKPGKVVRNEWVDQMHNRNLAMEDARATGRDYVLCIDADEVLVPDEGFSVPDLTADAYDVFVRYGTLEIGRPMLVRAALPWRWSPRRHPLLSATGSGPRVVLPGVVNVATPTGASWNDPAKQRTHLAEMRQIVEEEPTRPRARYYLAQSCVDVARRELEEADLADEQGQVRVAKRLRNSARDFFAEAAEHFAVRALMPGGSVEETYCAFLERAKALQLSESERPAIEAAYRRAHTNRPQRAEAAYYYAWYLRSVGDLTAARMWARAAYDTPRPDDRLFVDWPVYAFRACQLLAWICAEVGDLDECRRLTPEFQRRVDLVVAEDARLRAAIAAP